MPAIGEQAPDFELYNQDRELIRLSDFRGQKVILFAFPKANTAGCNAQACGFRDEFPRVASSNTVILGISGDSQDVLKRWKTSKNLPYDLLSDPDHGVLEQWNSRRKAPLINIGLPFTIRSHWVIDEDGVVIDAQVGISPADSVKEALAHLESLEHTQAN